MIYANPIVGRTGLCNMLFIWARALVFAKERGATMLAPQWTNFFRLGPLLRFERNKRYYINEFTNKGYVGGVKKRMVNLMHRHLPEGDMTRVSDGDVVDFFGWSDDYFQNFIGYHGYIKESLATIVNPTLVSAADTFGAKPFIGVHIRRGDFVTNGQWIPDEWYRRGITKARELVGQLPIRVFSDSSPDKLMGITSKFEDCEIMPKASAVQDLLMLSNSKCLVATAKSTFSMWSVFLGQMPSIWRDDDLALGQYIGKNEAIVLKDA